MYIAFKWLVFLTSLMWLATCIVSLLVGPKLQTQAYSDDIRSFGLLLKNTTVKNRLKSDTTQGTVYYHNTYDKAQTVPGLHFIMFAAGALSVTAFHKKQCMLSYAHQKIVDLNLLNIKNQYIFKKAAATLNVAMAKYLQCFWEIVKNVLSIKIVQLIRRLKIAQTVKNNDIPKVLLKKLKEMTEERKSLGQLLISAIHENKNIRMRYELETITKNRLMQHIEDTHNQIKENRSKYVNFQQLYLITHQENNYLKARLGKLQQENVETQKNLMGLINEVYRSNNKELKAYCSKFIVNTKHNLLNSNVETEIKKFLKNSRIYPERKTSITTSKNWSSRSSIRITEILNEDASLAPLVSDAPKLKGLPGEYVWTVKDKDGIIEKLYEYDFESDLVNRDTIKRIRQYSVYYDKDCLLDFSKTEHETKLSFPIRSISPNHPLGIQKIVTGSEAFQNFLQSTIGR